MKRGTGLVLLLAVWLLAGGDARRELYAFAHAAGPVETTPCLTIKHAGMPQVTTIGTPGGGILTPLKLISVVPDNLADKRAKLFAFGDQMASGFWLPAVAGEYGVHSTGVNIHASGASITLPADGQWSEAKAREYIDGAISGTAGGHGNGNLYVLYLPAGLKVADPGQSTNPHHRSFGTDAQEAYAVIQPDDPTLDHYTLTASHEIVEAATDTSHGTDKGFALHNDASLKQNLQTVWLTANGNLHVEVADLCSGTRIRIGPFLYQRSFSNQAASGEPCVPHNAKGWFNTTPSMTGGLPGLTSLVGWYRVPAGTHAVDIDVYGWVSGDRPDHCSQPWKVSAGPIGTDQAGGFQPTKATLSAHTLGNGGKVRLHVEIPQPLPAGTYWGAVRVKSAPKVDDPDDDDFHIQVFGVYVN